MEKFRENAQVIHNAAAKRKIAAALIKKESSTQLRIFNTLFTAEGRAHEDEEEETEEARERREKEKKLESMIQARIEQREAEEKEREAAEAERERDERADDKDLFANLSPISSTEDECEDEGTRLKVRRIVLHRVLTEIKDIPPWIVVDPLPTGPNKPKTKEVSIQTEYIAPSVTTTAVNTDTVEVQDSETQFRIEATENYEDVSAFEVIMEQLTEEIYLEQLLAWRRRDSSRRLSLTIKPESLENAAILKFEYLKTLDSFVLLLRSPEKVALEKWSLKNLIKPKLLILPADVSQSDSKTIDMVAGDYVTLGLVSETVYSIASSTWQISQSLDVRKINPIAITLAGSSFILANDNKFFVYSTKSFILLRSFRRSPIIDGTLSVFCSGIFLAVASQSYLSLYNHQLGVHLNSIKIAKDDNEIDRRRPIKAVSIQLLPNNDMLIFHPSFNEAIIINLEKFATLREFEYDFNFKPQDTPLAFAATKNVIFSIDSDGKISKWDLLNHHRKLRSKVMTSYVTNPRGILAVTPNIFVIPTSLKLTVLIIPD